MIIPLIIALYIPAALIANYKCWGLKIGLLRAERITEWRRGEKEGKEEGGVKEG